jgi:heme exporter protein D
MQDNENAPVQLVFSNETLLLWFAVGLAVVFLGLLAFDLIRRHRRSGRRQRSGSGGVRATLFKPVQSMRELRDGLEQMARERDRRNNPPPPHRPPETPP